MGGEVCQAVACEESIEPLCVWRHKRDVDSIEIHLQGFKEEQIKIVLSSDGKLKIRGERPILEIERSRTRKFEKEIPISGQYDGCAIRARLVDDWLCIDMPKGKAMVLEKEKGSFPLAAVVMTVALLAVVLAALLVCFNRP